MSLADFLKANKEGIISIPQFCLDRSNYSGEIMIWSGTRDQDFSNKMGQLISNSYPHSQQVIFDDSHEREKYPEYYRDFRIVFFIYGLNSPELKIICDTH